MEFDSKIAIGISLGTVNCCVGASVQGQVKIIPNDQGNLTTYSYVAFTNEEYLIGDAAKGQASLNPKNTLYDFMKLIGRKFSDPFVQTVSLDWPFKIEPDPEDDPLFIVEYKGEVKKYKPQEITQMMLARLKGNAEYYIGKTVTDAVVTVPDSFNEFQLKLIEKAATAAGLNVVKITNESFAAVRAYEFDKKDFSEKNDKMKTIFIFNIGGNSLNISIVGINDGICELVTYLSDSGIGGKRFDYKLAEYIIDNVLEEHKTDITQNRRAMTRLLNQCDRVKRILSVTGQVVCEIDSLINGIDLLKEISREKFEELCSSYFERCLELSEKSLKEAGKPKEAIDEVILIGGSSRIPKIRQLLAKFFERQASSNTLFTPESALAYGATVITDTLLAPKARK